MAEVLKMTDQPESVDFSLIRQAFPALSQPGKNLAYLDSAASAQKPAPVIEAMTAVMENHYANIHRGLYEYSQLTTAAYENARAKIARFIGAPQTEEVIFTRNATEAINLVAQGWAGSQLQAGDEIILSEMEHHANLVPWQLLRDRLGVKLKFIPVTEEGGLDLEAFEKLLSPKTKLVALVHISNVLGAVNSVKHISELAKRFNPEIKVLLDGSQAVVHTTVNIAELGCDFYCFTGHKLYGPTGIGVLWGRYALLAAMPPYQGGGDMVETVTKEKSTFKAPPARFEAGTPPIIEAIGLGAAVDFLTRIGMAAIEAREKELLAYAQDQLGQIKGLRVIGQTKDKAGIMSFTAEWGQPGDIGMLLDQSGVAVRTGHHCCQPLMQCFGVTGTVRASLGVYNNRDDINRLVAGLEKARSMLS